MSTNPPSDPSRRRFIGSGLVSLLGAGVGGAAASQEPDPEQVQEWVAYCGLYCGLCSNHGKLKRLASDLLATLRADETQETPEFLSRLQELRDTPPEKCCRLDKCGHPRCAIRKCARRKGVFVCAECDAFPCDKVKTLAASEPTLVADGRRLHQIGLEAWTGEQETRRAMGFCYTDARCGHCTVPTE